MFITVLLFVDSVSTTSTPVKPIPPAGCPDAPAGWDLQVWTSPIVDILCQHICCIGAGIDMLICRNVDEMLAMSTQINIMSTRIHTLNTHET